MLKYPTLQHKYCVRTVQLALLTLVAFFPTMKGKHLYNTVNYIIFFLQKESLNVSSHCGRL